MKEILLARYEITRNYHKNGPPPLQNKTMNNIN